MEGGPDKKNIKEITTLEILPDSGYDMYGNKIYTCNFDAMSKEEREEIGKL